MRMIINEKLGGMNFEKGLKEDRYYDVNISFNDKYNCLQ